MLPLDKTTEGGQVKVICIKAKVISWKNKLIFGPQDLFFYFEIFLKMFWKALDLGYRKNTINNLNFRIFRRKNENLKVEIYRNKIIRFLSRYNNKRIKKRSWIKFNNNLLLFFNWQSF